MFQLRRPAQKRVAAVLAEQQTLEPDDSGIGLTHPDNEVKGIKVPPGWAEDRHRVLLGEGEAFFRQARARMLEWRMYQNGWTTVAPQAPPETGKTFLVTARHFGFYSLNALRVVYTLDEANRASFAVAALPGHVERGEERFMVWRDAEDKVWFELYAVSTPKHPLARLAYPLARWVQKRFFTGAKAQMLVGLQEDKSVR